MKRGDYKMHLTEHIVSSLGSMIGLTTLYAYLFVCSLHVDERAIGDCGGTYADDTGFITSPGYPDYYSDNVDCEYYITVSDGYVIHLIFREFYLASYGDYLSVYDGPSELKPNGYYEDRIAYLKGTMSDITDVIISTDVNITVLFHSDSSNTFPGFYATWTAINVNTMGICGSTYTDDIGTLTSPGYPADYSNNADCYFYITLSSGNRIQLMFYELDTERDNDLVEVYDGDGISSSAVLIGSYSGTDRPPLITSTGNSLTVHFTSDYSTTKDGFYAMYSVAASFETAVCTISEPVGSITSMGGTIVSHTSYPGDYSSPQTCVLTLTNFEAYTYIYLKFLEIDVYGCSGGDYIRVDDDNEELGTICESSHVGTEFTSNTLIKITFNAVSHTGTYQGFKAVYSLYYRTYFSSDTCDYSTDFKCDNGNCIDSSLRSDGYDHCGDNSDENSSSSTSSSSTTLIIIGVVIGVIVFLVIIIGAICYWMKSKTPSATSPATTNTTHRALANESAFPPTPVGGYYQPPEATTVNKGVGAAPNPYTQAQSAAPNPYYNANEVPNPYANQINQGGYNPNMVYNPSEPAKGNDVKPLIE